MKKSIKKEAFEIPIIEKYKKALTKIDLPTVDIIKGREEIIQQAQNTISKIKTSDILEIKHVYNESLYSKSSKHLFLLTSNKIDYYLNITFLENTEEITPISFGLDILKNNILKSDTVFTYLPFIINEYIYFNSSYSSKRKLNSSFSILGFFIQKEDYANALNTLKTSYKLVSSEKECELLFSNISRLFDNTSKTIRTAEQTNLENYYISLLENSILEYPNLSNQLTPMLIASYYKKEDYLNINKLMNSVNCDSNFLIEKIKPQFNIYDEHKVLFDNDIKDCLEMTDTTFLSIIADKDTILAGDIYTCSVKIKTNKFHPSECKISYWGREQEIINGEVIIKFRAMGRPKLGIFKKTIPIEVWIGDNYISKEIEYYVER